MDLALASQLRMGSDIRVAFSLCVAGCLLLIAVSLHYWGAAEIRANGGEVVFLTLIGGVWLALGMKLFSWWPKFP